MQIAGYNFTRRLQGTLWDAVAQAQALNHEYIGTEHLLLALLVGRDGCGAAALRTLGVDLQGTANRVLTIVQHGVGSHDPSSGALLPFTSRSKKVLELAKEEAKALNHALIGTEHLLLGMLAEGKGIAAQVLHDAGVDLEKARAQVVAILGTTSDDDSRASNQVPAGDQPASVRVVLEYMNGAVVSNHFTTTREAMGFLEEQGRV
jgi:ATP-dependent Clp protease ATP-binding subunit ClpC